MARRATLNPLAASWANGSGEPPLRGRASVDGKRHSLMGGRPSSSRPSMGFGGRPSILGDARGPSAVRRGGDTRISDPRPTNDKAYMKQSIQVLITFLTEHNYDRAISPKILTAPSRADFESIFTFLVRAIEPSFTIQGKLEEEVPGLLIQLGYPFTVSKANLSAVGSPHAWPHLLAALTWLLDIAVIADRTKMATEEQQPSMASIFSDYLAKAYAAWIETDDTTDEDEELHLRFDAQFGQAAEHVDTLRAAHAELVGQRESLRNEPSPLQEATSKNGDLRSDLDKFEALVRRLTEHTDQLRGKVTDQEEELADLQAQCAEANAEVDRLWHEVDAQELSAAEAERMYKEEERLRAALR